MHLRAQLLRIEQEKELMRVKLEEEVAEREKAQKQARPDASSLAAVIHACLGASLCFTGNRTGSMPYWLTPRKA